MPYRPCWGRGQVQLKGQRLVPKWRLRQAQLQVLQVPRPMPLARPQTLPVLLVLVPWRLCRQAADPDPARRMQVVFSCLFRSMEFSVKACLSKG